MVEGIVCEAVLIEKWSVGGRKADRYLPPEVTTPCLCGNVFGHPHFEDGKDISTSVIVGADEEEGVIICKSRQYKLGAVDSEYEGRFPNARQRLLDTWTEVQT